MRKIMVMIMLIAVAAVTASAECVWYQVKYTNEYGNVRTVKYMTEIDTDLAVIYVEDTLSEVGDFDYNEIVDEDSDAKDLAIVNKLDRQGYIIAGTDYDGVDLQVVYVKSKGKWHKIMWDVL